MVGPRRGNARGDHVRVADRLDLLEAVALGEGVEVAEQPVEQPTTSAGRSCWERGVKSTTSAKRTDASVNWSAMVSGLAFSRSAIVPGRMLRSRLSARSCSARSSVSASARCFANSASSVNTVVPPTAMLSVSIRCENHSGRVETGPTTMPASPHTQEHRQEGDVPADSSLDTPEDQGPERSEDAPDPNRARRHDAAERDHRDGRRHEDRGALYAEQGVEVSVPCEHEDRAERDRAVGEREQARSSCRPPRTGRPRSARSAG